MSMKLESRWPGRRLGLGSRGVGAAVTPRLCRSPDCRPFIVQQKGSPPPDTWSRAGPHPMCVWWTWPAAGQAEMGVWPWH